MPDALLPTSRRPQTWCTLFLLWTQLEPSWTILTGRRLGPRALDYKWTFQWPHFRKPTTKICPVPITRVRPVKESPPTPYPMLGGRPRREPSGRCWDYFAVFSLLTRRSLESSTTNLTH